MFFFPQKAGEFSKFFHTRKDLSPERRGMKRPPQNEKVLRTSTNYDDVVFITFCMTQAYLGTDCLTRRTESMINALNYSGKLSAVVHFGNPFILEDLPHIPRILVGTISTPNTLYTIDMLAGELPVKGKAPYDIKLK